ncbi:PAS domain S-box-containing protein [Nitrosomonas communis]|uniref:PAS domain S-box-containing protein n=2 Tax=Nitrosomonas communis TaxID=44574 RepID=A0A1H2XKY0_9PROT|nr:PAS domain S-box-containing protein [Nitrosomonas communis]
MNGFVKMITHYPFPDDVLEFQELIDLLPLAIFIKNAESKILAMNKACELQWGINFKNIQGTDGSQFFSSEQMKQFLGRDKEVFRSFHQIEFEGIIPNYSLGQKRIVRTSKKPLYNKCGKPVCLIGISMDITERREAEQSIMEMTTLSMKLLHTIARL